MQDNTKINQPQEAFSLLCYADPWDSPVGGQLDPAGREPVCAQLNSAILGKISLQRMFSVTQLLFCRIKKSSWSPPFGNLLGPLRPPSQTDVKQ